MKGESDRAIADLDQVIRLNPKNANSYGVRGRAYFDKGEFERAIADYEEAIRLNPGDAPSREGRERAQAALAALPSAAEDAGTCRNGSGNEAIAACSRTLKRNTKDASAYYNRGSAFSEKGEYDLAIADFDEAIRLGPNDASAYNARGLAYAGKAEYERAVADYDEALKLDQNLAAARQNRDRAQAALAALPTPGEDADTCRKGAGDDAIAACTRMLKRDPKEPVLYVYRGSAYAAKRDYNRAITDFDQVIKVFPAAAIAYNARGLSYNAKAEYDRAIIDFDQVIKLTPQAALAYNNRGLVRTNKGEYDLAIADFERALKLDPTEVLAYANRGFAYNGKEEYDRAIADLDQAIKLKPDYANAYSHRGFAYGQKGDFDRATADLDKAITLDVKYARGYSNRAAIYELRGDHDRAVADFETALKLDLKLAAAADVRKVQAAIAARPAAAPPAPALRDPVAPTHRVALVVGNSAYRSVPALRNPRRDAEAVAEALHQAGFQTVQLAEDLDRESMVKALQAFREEADKADWALVYFAGHGIEMNKVNYLIPVDATLVDERDVKAQAVSYEELLDAVDGARMLRLVILDACRENPFKAHMHRASASRGSLSRGLAPPPEMAPGTLVVYSAKEGEVAADDVDGVNSPFARAFVKQLTVPGREVRRLFDYVRDDVLHTTGSRQQPYTYGSLPGERDFFFVSAR
jgi:tetratricopeptide (TPR) repeat protein